MKRATVLTSVLAISMLLGGAIQMSTVNAAPGDRIQSAPTTQGPATMGTIQAIQVFNCATGFNKTNHQKDAQGVTTVLECTTPTIVCPPNSKYAGLIMDKEKATVGQGVQFRYRCKYFTPPK